MRRTLIVLVAAVLTAATVPEVVATPASQRVTITRDGFGVPIVTATSVEGLFYGMGYVAADDRLWQAEILRRGATGTLAELLGPGALAGDIQARLFFGPAERRAEAFAQASAELQTILSSYVAGINARIAEGNLPPEFGVFGPPRPWMVDDSIAVFMLLGSRFGWFGADELANFATWQALVARFGLAEAQTVFGDLFWLDDPDAPATVPTDGVGLPGRRAGGPPPSLPTPETVAVAGQHAVTEAAVDRARRMAGLPADGWASNAMVIAPLLSRDGAALLLGGPQMDYSTPQINHEVGLRGAGFHVTGMSIAGFPLVPVGVGDGFAWTLTSGGSDNTDIYLEELNPADPSQYLFQGQWRTLDCRQEVFEVAGAPSHTQTLCESLHGPILGAQGGFAFSLKNVTVGAELDSLEAWLGLGRAKNLRQFAENLDVIAYNFNVLYADRAGNIAYWHIGHIPIRPTGTNPFFPLSGTGDQEWEGILPFSEMPRALNPSQGWLANWNSKPAPGWVNSSADFWLWGGAHRVDTFIHLAEEIAPRTATMGTLKEVNRIGGWTTDTPTGQASSVFVSSYLEAMLGAVDSDADPRLPGVVEAMFAWDRLQVDADGDGFYDEPYGTIFNAWWFALAHGVFDEVADLTSRFVLGNLVDRLLRGIDAALPLGFDYLGGVTVEEAVTGALIAALDQLTAEFGSNDPDDWRQPISEINWAPLGVGAVPPTIWMNRGTYNQLVHLRGRLSAENVVAPGQSGDPLSPHFADQLELYATWQYKPMRLTAADLVGNVESVVVLEVP